MRSVWVLPCYQPLTRSFPAPPAPPVRKPDDPTQPAKDKALLRLYITHGVLRKLGYSEQRVMTCLGALNGRLAVVGSEDKVTQGWEEALEWVSGGWPRVGRGRMT